MLYTARVEVSTVQPPTARIPPILWHRPPRRSAGRGSPAGRYRCIDVSMYGLVEVGSRFCTGSESNTCSCTFRKYVSKKRGCHGTPPDPTSTWTARHFQHGPLLGRPARLPLRTPRRPARAKSAVLGYHIPASSSGSAHACACSCHVSRAWESDCLRCVGPRPLA